ncbi:MAG: PQQ-dependent sugar dehydrogenase [Pedobacter sp.]
MNLKRFANQIPELLHAIKVVVILTIQIALPIAGVIAQNKSGKISTPSDIVLNTQQLAATLQAPTAMAFPSPNEIWITEQTGKIRVIKNGKLIDESILNLKSKLPPMNDGYEERGLLGIALHPKFKSNKKFYVYYSTPSSQKSNHTGVLAEYNLTSPLDPESGRIIFMIEEPDGNHNGGCIQFGPDGYLYVSLGDGGGQGDKHGEIGNGQELNTLHGKILRIDIDTAKGYKIPPDNPFVGKPGTRPEIWAYGFRNPWRFSFDRASGKLFAGDVGQNEWEEVDIVKKGGNYGWRLMEGTHCYNPAKDCDTTGLELPITEYSHREGISVTGGYVYNGKQIPGLKSKYVFSDWWGPVFYLQKTGAKWTRGKIVLKGLPEGRRITGFGEDSSGELFVLINPETGPENTGGGVYKIVKN